MAQDEMQIATHQARQVDLSRLRHSRSAASLFFGGREARTRNASAVRRLGVGSCGVFFLFNPTLEILNSCRRLGENHQGMDINLNLWFYTDVVSLWMCGCYH